MKKQISSKSSFERSKRIWAYAFLVIPVLFYIIIRFYPTFYAFFLSLTDWDIISRDKNFIGIENYIKLFHDPIFWKTLGNTFEYVIYGLPVSLILGFIIAYNIDKVDKGSGIFKSVYFIPYITSLVALSWVWRWLYQPAPIGVFNKILISLGLSQQLFLFSQTQALFSILVTTIWSDVGFQMIIFLAGIKGISKQYYEAAEIDGAGNKDKLLNITIPLLKPTIIFLLVTGTIRYLRLFTQVLNMTFQGEGGPLNSTKPLVLYIYNSAFSRFDMGYASAMTVVLFLIIMIITLIQLRVMKSEN
ncbi:MAG: sugar ABC transporter permease [Spirochaetia bacterium]|nr:sugar ABC transporter permease [Spirochaetia bacterium]